MKREQTIGTFFLLSVLAVLAWGTWHDPNFWSTADRRGDKLAASGKFSEAAKVYQDPLRVGIAQFRNGDFETATRTFARVPGATGAFNAGDAALMHGAYDQAITLYEKALGFRPDWKEAEENKQLAIARRDSMKVDDKVREEEEADAYKPDQIVFDQKGSDKAADKPEPGGEQSDAALQATWLRRVKTTPADFLKAKFAWQSQTQSAPEKP